MKNARYTLIYKFFATQIQFGYYKTGDFLPSIEDLCQIYHASGRTVRSAYLQLQEDGYVSLSSGRRTTVVYQATAEECARSRRSYYLARMEAAPALNEAMKLLLLPVMRNGCERLTPQAMSEIREMAAKLGDGDFYISFFGGYAMVMASENQLASALFSEVVSFYQFPHVLLRFAGKELEVRQFQELSARVIAACDRNDCKAFYDAYMAIQTYMNDVLNHYLILAKQLLPAQEQIPFTWNVYRDRPQLCYSVAARIIKEICIACCYQPGDTLPHHAILAEKYQVSYMTIRRTMEMLESMGIVSVRHGVGTTVTEPQPDPARYQNSAMRRIHTMALESMELLRLAFDSVTAQLSADVSARDCAEILRAQSKRGLTHSAFITCMDLLFRGSTNLQLRNIWDRLFELLLLDLPLLEAAGLHAALDTLIHCLDIEDFPSFRIALKEQMLQLYNAAKAIGEQFIS
ncbi:hypothetical protein CE91St41_17710 [Oscillospiraceae bacterium]|nr:hypothetical protein CE91St40_19820 [Oscillospiraceae bacterium]BDF74882.1 hypothetical protein CE91St41_17710 [Oscillospiraceae bacterium]